MEFKPTLNNLKQVVWKPYEPEPLIGKRMVTVTERKTKRVWACFLEEIARQYESAEKITLVMDNLNTHEPGLLYETFPPGKAKALL